jgi:hypothetical protein
MFRTNLHMLFKSLGEVFGHSPPISCREGNQGVLLQSGHLVSDLEIGSMVGKFLEYVCTGRDTWGIHHSGGVVMY